VTQTTPTADLSDVGVLPMLWQDGALRMLDQTLLPGEERWLELRDEHAVAEAIKTMRVRGAPAIGVAAAYGVALAARRADARNLGALLRDVDAAADELGRTRPTAVNLFWALDRMRAAARRARSADECRALLLAEAVAIDTQNLDANRRMGALGAELIPEGATVLTHCNAGALATNGYGTALGVIRAAHAAGKGVQVFADETRPLLQGARLTAWELTRDAIPTTLIADNMAGLFMRRGRITCVIVGADRIAANGDVANKIGTYQVAVLAKEHGVPFYVAAPLSTIDLSIPTGDEIPIEERGDEEMRGFGGARTAPEEVSVANPAFDVTPAKYVTAIITENGIARAPYEESLADLTPLAPLPSQGRGEPRHQTGNQGEASATETAENPRGVTRSTEVDPGTPFPAREGGRGG
jgi:methylthioribose-1-phosphate isomerase